MNATYGISTTLGSQGQQLLSRFEATRFPNESEPVLVQESTSSGGHSKSFQKTSSPDEVMDILVLYTEKVRRSLDGSSGNANTKAFAKNVVRQTQLAFDRSQSTAQVNFIHSQLSQAVETDDISFDLDSFRVDSQAISLRNFWAADMVFLLRKTLTTSQSGTCGIAYSPRLGQPGPDFSEYAMGLIEQVCAAENLSFAHELAHTLGAQHNPENTPNPFPPPGIVRPWAYGHWGGNSQEGFRTIMSYYISGCPSSCPRIPNFSNASVYEGTFPTGISGQRENARVLSEFAPKNAEYRTSLGRIFADDFGM